MCRDDFVCDILIFDDCLSHEQLGRVIALCLDYEKTPRICFPFSFFVTVAGYFYESRIYGTYGALLLYCLCMHLFRSSGSR